MAKKEKNDQNKVRMNISISREMYDFITKTRGNASKIAERAYYALFSASKNNADVFVLDLNALKIAQNGEKDPISEWSRRDSNTCSPACKAGVITT